MSKPAIQSLLILACWFTYSCAQIKEAGRTVGHTTHEVAVGIGHGARDATRAIGHGARDAAQGIGEGISGGTREGTNAANEEVKTVVKPAPKPTEY